MRIQALLWRVWPLTRLASILDERDLLREMTAVKLKSLSVDERGQWVMALSHDIVPLIADSLLIAFKNAKATNYVEYEAGLKCKGEADFGNFTVTLQLRTRPTPHEKRRLAEHKLWCLAALVGNYKECTDTPAIADALRATHKFLEESHAANDLSGGNQGAQGHAKAPSASEAQK